MVQQNECIPGSVSLLARLTTRDIISSRLHRYFGSALGKIWTVSGLVVPLLGWLVGMSNAAVGFWVPFMTLFAIPAGVAFGGIKSREVQALIDPGIRYRLSDEGVDWERSHAAGSHGWPLIRSARETRTALLLLTEAATIVLPKRCFEDAGDVDIARELVRRYVPAAALFR